VSKRLPLALFLSAAAFVLWTYLFPPPPRPPAPTQEATAAAASASESAASAPAGTGSSASAPVASEPLLGEVEAEQGEREEVLVFGRPGEPGYWRARFTNRGARLLDLRSGNHYVRGKLDAAERADPENWTRLAQVVEGDARASLSLAASASSASLTRGPLEQALWAMRVLSASDGTAQGIEFSLAPGSGVRFVKRVKPVPGTWDLALELELENLALEASGPREFALIPAAWMPVELGDSFYIEPRAAAAGGPLDEAPRFVEIAPGKAAKTPAGALDVPRPIAFAGTHNKYFAALLRPADPASAARVLGARYVSRLEPERGEDHRLLASEIGLELELPAIGQRSSAAFVLYAGPKDPAVFVKDSEAHELVLDSDRSFFSAIDTLLLAVLGIFHRLVGNWGVAIILLTLLVRVVLFPLNRRSQTAMARYAKKMKRVQPKLEEIKQKHAKDPTKLRQEQGRIMQEEGAFPPLGGCLPVFLQLPIFFGLFSALRTSFDLRQAPFAWWIEDLSRPDELLRLDWNLPLIFTNVHVAHLNLLPILMVALWLGQQMTMPKPTDEQAARMQKMMMFMPVVMGFFLYEYAAGLSLYMITSSGIAILEQTVVKRVWPIDDTEQARKPGAGCGPFSGAMQRLAEKQKEQIKRMEQMRGQGGGKGGKGQRGGKGKSR
jgi:YidC/Oxa1 family membrane protein insertase